MNWQLAGATALLMVGFVAALIAFALLIADYTATEEERNDKLIGVLLATWVVFWSLGVGVFPK